MTWWILATIVVALPWLFRALDRTRALPAAEPQPALPPSAVGLRERLASLDTAIGEVRSVIDLVPPHTAQVCAHVAMVRASLDGLPGMVDTADADVASGPGTARFSRLLAELSSIADDDLRDLADVGLDPKTVIAAMSAPKTPERWTEELLERLDYWQQTLQSYRTRRYG